MRFNDAVTGAVLIVFALAMIAWTTTFPSLYGQDYGPDLFPVLIGAGMALCGAILVIRGLRERGTVPMVRMGDWASDRRIVANVGLLIGSVVFYILFSDFLGFVPVAFGILVLLLVRLGTGLLASIAIAAAVTLAIHSVFAKVLLVPLPWGLLQPIAW